MHTVIQPLAVLAQGLLLCAERGVAPAPPPPAGPGVMGDAYAQARARAGEQLRDGRQEAQALGQRQVSIPGRPASDPTAKGAAPAQSRSSPESKSQAGKRKREQEEAGSAAGAGGMVDQAPPCVTANVWKAAKVAAARLDEETGRQEEEKATQTLILDAALKCGMGGRHEFPDGVPGPAGDPAHVRR